MVGRLMNKKIMLFLILLVSIVSIRCVSAANMTDVDLTVLSDSDDSLDIEDSISVSDNRNDGGERPMMELPRDYDKKKNKTIEIIGPKIPANYSNTEIIAPKINRSGTFEELQSLIDNAESWDTVVLNKDYYGKKKAKIIVNKNLTIDGRGHTIDCKSAEDCIAFYSTMGQVTLMNLYITNGYNDDNYKGGAIFIGKEAKYSIINCKFINNWADDYGGAIYNAGPNALFIRDSLFSGNEADDDDGGAIFSNGAVEAINITFKYNKANDYGGAVYINCNKYSSFKDCLFKFNEACDDSGGAIYSKGELYLKYCTLESNEAKVDGGAVYAENVCINRYSSKSEPSVFLYNEAEDNDGGAVYADNTVKVFGTEFWHNSAYENGGAMYCDNAYVSNSNFGNNKAMGAKIEECEGGAIYADSDVYLYENCSFMSNEAEHHGGIDAEDLYICHPSVKFLGNRAVKDLPYGYFWYGNSSLALNHDVDADIHIRF